MKKSQRLIQEEKDLLIEVTLAGRGFQRIVHQLKRVGYTVTIVFIFLKSPEVCIARVRNRVMAGGHHVPDGRHCSPILSEQAKLLADLQDAQVDKWDLFYNSGDSLEEVASTGQGDEISP